MGMANLLDSTLELIQVIQLRNYFTENKDKNTESSKSTSKNKLKQNILKGKVKLFPAKDKQGYIVSGENILNVKKELKSIGAFWNEESKSVELTNDTYINNIDKETKIKIEKDIVERLRYEVNIIKEKIINKDLEIISENERYRVSGYTSDVKNILENLGFEKINGYYNIDKLKFKEIFTPEITQLVDIYNNEYEEKINDKEPEKEKLDVEICIMDMKDKSNNKWIKLPISRLNFSKCIEDMDTTDLKITKIKSNDTEIQKIFKGKAFSVDTDTIHKFNVLTRKINDLSDDKLKQYTAILAVEGLSKINDFIKCADELKMEQTMEIN